MTTPGDRDSRSPRILIVRLSAIGDSIHTLPVLCALRDRFPNAMLAWVIEEKAATLLRGHKALDELIAVPRGFLKSPRAVWSLRRRLSALNFDVALDTQSLTKSALVARLSAARRRIGFSGRWGRELSPWLNSELVRPRSLHVIDRYLELLEPLGITAPAVRFDVPLDDSERAAAARWVAEAGLTGGYALLNPGAGWPSKLWPADRYAAVARHLGQRWSLPSVALHAGDQERAWAEQIVGRSSGWAKLAPPTSLRELAALAAPTAPAVGDKRGGGARLFVGSDTGPLHLAVAMGTPCVGLYGPWPASETGPYGLGNVAVQKMVLESSNSRDRRHAESKYMEAIDVAGVCEACDKLLRRGTFRAA